MPAELDEVERRVMQLEIEREALRKESDKASKERLEKLERELADLKEQRGRLKAQWEQEKEGHSEPRAEDRRKRWKRSRLEIERRAARRRLREGVRAAVRPAAGTGARNP